MLDLPTKARNDSEPVTCLTRVNLRGIDLNRMPCPDLTVAAGECHAFLWGTLDHDLGLLIKDYRMGDLIGLARHIHSEVSGVYFLLLVDTATQQAVFFTDYFSCKKVFYCQTAGALHFADNFYVLAKSGLMNKDLDMASIATFLMYDYIPTNHTLVKGIRSVGAFCIYLAKEGHISEFRSDHPEAKPKSMNYTECVSETYRRLEEAFLAETRQYSHVVVPLSGGQDSRLLLALALKHYDPTKITTFTFGQPGTLDYEIGRKLARQLGLRCMLFTIERGFFNRHIVPSTRYLNGMTNHMLAPSNLLSQAFDDTPMGVVISGYIGDLVVGSKDGYIPVCGGADCEYPSPKQCGLSQVLPLVPHAASEVVDRLQLLQKLIGRSRVKEGIPVESWYYVVRVTSFTSIGLFSERLKVKFITPFVNRKFLDWALSIPKEFKRQDNFYRDLAASDGIAKRLFEYPLKNRDAAGAWDRPMKALVRKIRYKAKAVLSGVKPKQNFANFEAMYPEYFVTREVLKGDVMFSIFGRKAMLELCEQMSYSQKTLLLALRLHLECLQDQEVLSQE